MHRSFAFLAITHRYNHITWSCKRVVVMCFCYTYPWPERHWYASSALSHCKIVTTSFKILAAEIRFCVTNANVRKVTKRVFMQFIFNFGYKILTNRHQIPCCSGLVIFSCYIRFSASSDSEGPFDMFNERSVCWFYGHHENNILNIYTTQTYQTFLVYLRIRGSNSGLVYSWKHGGILTTVFYGNTWQP